MKKYIEDLLLKYRKIGAQDLFFIENDCLYMRYLGEIVKCSEIITPEVMNFFDLKFKNTNTIKENNDNFDIDGAYEVDDLRYRVNLFYSVNKRKSVVRIINNKIPSLEEIGVSPLLYSKIIDKKGFSLIVGKTCSGKSTTLAALIQKILDTQPWHIITLEDPIEYKFKNNIGIISQRELGRDFYNYSDGIISSLRQSPDLIIIGEIRDKNTLKSAVVAAESGSAVIATMHSIGSKMTIMRMISMFSSEERNLILFQLASHLNFIQSQKLIKETGTMKLDYELIINNSAISNSIKEGNLNNLDNLIILGLKSGMRKFSF